ncbi:alpha/beta hydrolase [Streptomyces sp. GESEQ-35]|uniref:alpha/beta fold hydrolase n=1 Tax=Streptomyces sp. GESEQ-35 TaxID=2812657 RepID=UPI0027E3310B|nr:alpha/beta hydrolase [Streptomyces sp. GESEQ-35]
MDFTYRVIAFDNGGVGGSGLSTPDTIEAMARDAVLFIRALGLDRVDLLGLSMGGFVALQRQVSRLEQANTELLARPEEREAELEAARAANRELTRALNQKGTAHRQGLAGPVVRLPVEAALGRARRAPARRLPPRPPSRGNRRGRDRSCAARAEANTWLATCLLLRSLCV